MQEDASERQSDSLLRTKIYIPLPRPDLIRRQRLIDTLQYDLQHDGQFNRRLTLVSAPAGYGKTTLVSQWLSEAGFPAAWLTLEKAENDTTRFLAYLLAALRTVVTDFGRDVEGMLKAPQRPPQELILTHLINDLAQLERCVLLVLDDYHVIQTKSTHEILNYLVEHLPANIHLVITSREDPPLPLHRLQARRQMLSVRQADLNFLEDEVAAFFRNSLKVDLTADEAGLLTRRTEGWITGLQLAAISMRKISDREGFIQSFTGSNRYILDYLFEEVFETQTPELKDFLLKTSILDRICADLADAVTGQPDGQLVLEQLEQSNFFIVPLDQSRQWYRYHRLFVDLLRHRLSLTTYRASSLHEAASRWFSDHGFSEEAIEHAIAGELWNLAGEYIEAAADRYLQQGELGTLLRWYRQVPEEIILSHPHWALSYAWPLILLGEAQEADRVLRHLKGMDIPPGDILHGRIAAAEAFLSRAKGDMQATIELSKQALRLLPDDDAGGRVQLAVNLGLITWHLGRLDEAQAALEDALGSAQMGENPYLHHTALLFMSRTMASRGDLQQATRYLNQAQAIGDQVPTAVLAHCDQADLYLTKNQVELAWEHLHKAKVIAEVIGNQEFRTACFIQEALFHLCGGDAAAGLASLEPALVISQAEVFPPLTLARIKSCQVQLLIALGEIDRAREIFHTIPVPHDAGTYTRFVDLNQARLLLAEGHRQQAIQVLQKTCQLAEKMDWGFGLLLLRLLLAVAEEDQERGLGHLKWAIEAAEPQGIIRAFLLEGERMIQLLKEAARQGIKPDFIGKILAAWDSGDRNHALISGLYEPLSERELEVLHLVAAGLSNRQIAEQLVVSLGTAKAHLHHIFSKLDVSSRTEAIAKARQLDIL